MAQIWLTHWAGWLRLRQRVSCGELLQLNCALCGSLAEGHWLLWLGVWRGWNGSATGQTRMSGHLHNFAVCQLLDLGWAVGAGEMWISELSLLVSSHCSFTYSQVASLYDYELQASLPCFVVVVSNVGDHLFTTQLYCCAQRGCKLGAGSCRCLARDSERWTRYFNSELTLERMLGIGRNAPKKPQQTLFKVLN